MGNLCWHHLGSLDGRRVWNLHRERGIQDKGIVGSGFVLLVRPSRVHSEGGIRVGVANRKGYLVSCLTRRVRENIFFCFLSVPLSCLIVG